MQVRTPRGQYKTRAVIHKPTKVDTNTGLLMIHGNGCHLYHNCLTCPRERCIYDEPNRRRCIEVIKREKAHPFYFKPNQALKSKSS